MARQSRPSLSLTIAALLLVASGRCHAADSRYLSPYTSAPLFHNEREGERFQEFMEAILEASGGRNSCEASAETNFTNCLPVALGDHSYLSMEEEDYREESAKADVSAVDTWRNYVKEMGIYASKATEFILSVEGHAEAWADLAHEWSFNTIKRYPYNTMLPTSNGKVDRYTDDVSTYAAALASFCAGFGDVAEETSTLTKEFQEYAGSLNTLVPGWATEARDLTHYSARVSDKVSYLARYASDLATSADVWYQNVEFLHLKDVNATAHGFDVLEHADYLLRYAQDTADSVAEWSRHAGANVKWAEDWAEWAEHYA